MVGSRELYFKLSLAHQAITFPRRHNGVKFEVKKKGNIKRAHDKTF